MKQRVQATPTSFRVFATLTDEIPYLKDKSVGYTTFSTAPVISGASVHYQ
jgi:hypothetical protein